MQAISQPAAVAPFAPPSGWRALNPSYDPWDPIRSLQRFGRHELTSVELTVTHLCNMRCEHCAVGDSLTMKEAPNIPLELIFKRLDEVEHLETISMTGGEPTFSMDTVRNVIIPVLKYARTRGVRTQLNSNVTMDYERYELIAPFLDVMHISFNYTEAADFHQVGFARTGREVKPAATAKMYERMIENSRKLAEGGLFVSAESMINFRTYNKISDIHRIIVEMGCLRHEVHPMYPSSFASGLPAITRKQMFEAVETLLNTRDPNVWMLFGTLPFFACSENEVERRLVKRLREETNVTVRNDPDGRNRVNVNIFSGDVYVTDFASVPSFGNIHNEKLDDVFAKWREHPMQQAVNCHCPSASCCGPNLLVSDMYYREVDFTKRLAIP
ncbi:radical SAM/CxCxxxxC motif protein YfkAB [Cohnella cholangitidis]|uniref:Radical SAM/CxCxxxxC motif protein YfkAB n=1 Tax=Cohnella cholangitidis TaxID=2598458 RepID=A0A7G5C3C1_9BACL|nr:radical SAM/CxCxxxxC motif protein YfkAB [Cohnella cholangitidis]QMV43705.1 radical SAM/CxCxxxxC motif protein YfkAB [Cohnella cholangitidis]